MTIRKTLIATLLLLGQAAFAQQHAVETLPDSIILPTTVNGTVTFKEWCTSNKCNDNHMRARLTPNTTFKLDGKALKFQEFRRGYAAMRAGDDSYALVVYETDTNTVTTIEISR